MLLCSCQIENFNTVRWVFSQITCLPQWPQINYFYYFSSLQHVIKHTYSLALWSVCPIIAPVTFTLIISRVIFSQNRPQKTQISVQIAQKKLKKRFFSLYFCLTSCYHKALIKAPARRVGELFNTFRNGFHWEEIVFFGF